MSDKPRVVDELEGLIKQAAVERSHYYVKSVCEKAIIAIGFLIKERNEARAELKKFVKFDAFLKDDGTAEELAAEKARSARLVEALEVVDYCDRSRGYPTGKEWIEIARLVKTALAEYEKPDTAGEST